MLSCKKTGTPAPKPCGLANLFQITNSSFSCLFPNTPSPVRLQSKLVPQKETDITYQTFSQTCILRCPFLTTLRYLIDKIFRIYHIVKEKKKKKYIRLARERGLPFFLLPHSYPQQLSRKLRKREGREE